MCIFCEQNAIADIAIAVRQIADQWRPKSKLRRLS
jgi:hypothetical protein